MISQESLELVTGTHIIRRNITAREITQLAQQLLAKAPGTVRIETYTTDGVDVEMEVVSNELVYRMHVDAIGSDVALDGDIIVTKNHGQCVLARFHGDNKLMAALRWIAADLCQPEPVKPRGFARIFGY